MDERRQMAVILVIAAMLVVGLVLIPQMDTEIPIEDKLFSIRVHIEMPLGTDILGSIEVVGSRDGFIIDSFSSMVQNSDDFSHSYTFISDNVYMFNETVLISFSIGIGGYSDTVTFNIVDFENNPSSVDRFEKAEGGIEVHISSLESEV